jgi:hypothetical protein
MGELLKSKGILWKSASISEKSARDPLDKARRTQEQISRLLSAGYGSRIEKPNDQGKMLPHCGNLRHHAGHRDEPLIALPTPC